MGSNTYVVSGSAEERKGSGSSAAMSMEQQLKQQFPGGLPANMNPQDFIKHLQKTGGLPGAGGAAGDSEDMPDLEGVNFEGGGGEEDDDMPSLETK